MGFNFDRISTMILNFIRVCDLKLYNCEKLSNQLYSLEMLNTHHTRPILPFICTLYAMPQSSTAYRLPFPDVIGILLSPWYNAYLLSRM